MSASVIAIIGLAACVWDLRAHRIPNILTLGTAVAGLIFQTVSGGWPGLGYSVVGLIVGVALFFPFFMLHGMGAGDVKLLGAFGAWLGPWDIVRVAVAAAIIGAIVALAVVIGRRRTRQTIVRLCSMAFFWSVDGVQPVPGITLSEPSRLALCYSLPITAGALMTIWLA